MFSVKCRVKRIKAVSVGKEISGFNLDLVASYFV